MLFAGQSLSLNRRRFLSFMGASSVSLVAGGLLGSSCSSHKRKISLIGIAPSTKDDVVLAEGLKGQLLVSWQDVINPQGDRFGFNNDYLAVHPLSPDSLLMWANLEFIHPVFVSGYRVGTGMVRTKQQIDLELDNVGGAIMMIRRQRDGRWKLDASSPLGRRLTGRTPIPFDHGPIAGSKVAMGTLANCAGGITPWNTILTCEENYDLTYGELSLKGEFTPSLIAAEKFYPNNSPLHYGWVVEVDWQTGKAIKRVGLGRFCHEAATCHPLSDGRVVVYSGEDKQDEHLYKFVSKRPKELSSGELFVLDMANQRWLSLSREKSPILKKNFKDQLQILCFARDAAKLLGATPLDRPEDIEIHPHTKEVYVCLTNNIGKLRPHGSILKLSHPNGNHESIRVQAETFKTGGVETGMTCPDNLVFDRKGNIWFTNDISDRRIGRYPYKEFGHNGLFLIPVAGPHQGKVIQLASAPKEAEFTGPCFSPDSKTLFLSVQHPGSLTEDLARPTSRWPGPTAKPSVIQISGPLLEQITLG